MTSANVKFGAKIDSRALKSPHGRTRLASFVLPLTFFLLLFPSVDVLRLNRSKDIFPKCVKSRGLRLVFVQTSGCEVVCTLKIRYLHLRKFCIKVRQYCIKKIRLRTLFCNAKKIYIYTFYTYKKFSAKKSSPCSLLYNKTFYTYKKFSAKKSSPCSLLYNKTFFIHIKNLVRRTLRLVHFSIIKLFLYI